MAQIQIQTLDPAMTRSLCEAQNGSLCQYYTQSSNNSCSEVMFVNGTGTFDAPIFNLVGDQAKAGGVAGGGVAGGGVAGGGVLSPIQGGVPGGVPGGVQGGASTVLFPHACPLRVTQWNELVAFLMILAIVLVAMKTLTFLVVWVVWMKPGSLLTATVSRSTSMDWTSRR